MPGRSTPARRLRLSAISKRTGCGCAWSVAMAPTVMPARALSALARRPCISKARSRSLTRSSDTRSSSGPVTVKAFAGLAAAQYRVEPDDPETTIRGPGLGGKAALETWWNISDRAWSSVDVSWSSLHDSYAARARLGWRFLPALSAGLEAGGAGNRECDIVRLGGFLRYEWESGELSASERPVQRQAVAGRRAAPTWRSRTRRLRRCLGWPASDLPGTHDNCAMRRGTSDESAGYSCVIVRKASRENNCPSQTIGECP